MSTALVYTRGSERSSHLPEVIQPRVREPGQFEDSVEDGVKQKPRTNKETRAVRGSGDLGWPSCSEWGGEGRERLEGSLKAVPTPGHGPRLGCFPSRLVISDVNSETNSSTGTHPSLGRAPASQKQGLWKEPLASPGCGHPCHSPSTAGLYDFLDLDAVLTMSVKLAPTTADTNSPGRDGGRIGSQKWLPIHLDH